MKKTIKAPVRGSSTGRPIMVLFDILGQRWTLRILWELRNGRLSFRALQKRCDQISPTVLNTRLKTLRALALIDLTADGFGYTPMGQDLSGQLASLDRWSQTWASQLS